MTIEVSYGMRFSLYIFLVFFNITNFRITDVTFVPSPS